MTWRTATFGAAALHAVPTADAVTNTRMRDVIGNKDDAHSSSSIYAKLDTTEQHLHSAGLVYPSLDSDVSITCGTSKWVLGSFTEIIPANTIAAEFDLHFAAVTMDDNVQYQINLYRSDAGPIATFKVTRDDKKQIEDQMQIITPLLPANTQIRAKAASNSTSADTLAIALFYHTY